MIKFSMLHFLMLLTKQTNLWKRAFWGCIKINVDEAI